MTYTTPFTQQRARGRESGRPLKMRRKRLISMILLNRQVLQPLKQRRRKDVWMREEAALIAKGMLQKLKEDWKLGRLLAQRGGLQIQQKLTLHLRCSIMYL